MSQKQQYHEWVTENLGQKTGQWYSPYIEQLGKYLKELDIESEPKDDFF